MHLFIVIFRAYNMPPPNGGFPVSIPLYLRSQILYWTEQTLLYHLIFNVEDRRFDSMDLEKKILEWGKEKMKKTLSLFSYYIGGFWRITQYVKEIKVGLIYYCAVCERRSMNGTLCSNKLVCFLSYNFFPTMVED